MTVEQWMTQVDAKLDRIIAKLNIVTKLEAMEMASIDDILDDVAELPTINDSFDVLFTKL